MKLICFFVEYSPIVQWSSIRAFGARDLGSNPSGAIFLGFERPKKFLKKFLGTSKLEDFEVIRVGLLNI